MAAGLAIASGACAAPEVAPTVLVTDSAGVRVTLTADSDSAFAAVDPEPALSIGGPEARGPERFSQVQDVLVDASGRIWVADGQSGELRIFEADGSHWKTRGGRGEGPGEFGRIRLLGVAAPDTMLVGDAAADRITVFDAAGDFVRTQPIPVGETGLPRPFHAFADGSVLAQLQRVVSASSLEAGQLLTDSVTLVRVSFEPPGIEPYGEAGGPLWIWTGRNQVPMPFTVPASFAVVGEDVQVVSGTAFQVDVFRGARLVERFGIDRASHAVAAGELVAYQRYVETYVAAHRRQDLLDALRHERRPRRVPGYDRLLAGGGQRTWARRYTVDPLAPETWDVYDAGRRFVGRVTAPPGFYTMAVSDTALTGVWRDDLGVEHVHRYTLRAPRGAGRP